MKQASLHILARSNAPKPAAAKKAQGPNPADGADQPPPPAARGEFVADVLDFIKSAYSTDINASQLKPVEPNSHRPEERQLQVGHARPGRQAGEGLFPRRQEQPGPGRIDLRGDQGRAPQPQLPDRLQPELAGDRPQGDATSTTDRTNSPTRGRPCRPASSDGRRCRRSDPGPAHPRVDSLNPAAARPRSRRIRPASASGRAGSAGLGDIGVSSSRRMATPEGASIPRRTWLRSIRTTVIRMSVPMITCCDALRLRTSMSPSRRSRSSARGGIPPALWSRTIAS